MGNWLTHYQAVALVKTAELLLPGMLSTGRFLAGVLRLAGIQLSLEYFVLFGQLIAGGREGVDIVSPLAILPLKIRHVGPQLLVLLQGLGVLAGSQGQSQQCRQSECYPRVLAGHGSSLYENKCIATGTIESG
jgi:hypothetical protein